MTIVKRARSEDIHVHVRLADATLEASLTTADGGAKFYGDLTDMEYLNYATSSAWHERQGYSVHIHIMFTTLRKAPF